MSGQRPAGQAAAAWCRPVTGGAILNLKVVPRASRDEIAGAAGGVLRVRLRAPPVEGRANEALVAFLAERLDLPRRTIEVLRGETARIKQVRIIGADPARITAALSPA